MKISKSHKVFAVLTVVFVVLVSEAVFPSSPPPFNFRYFESFPNHEKSIMAQKYLATRYPPGSDVADAVRELERAGANCNHTDARHDPNPDARENYFVCHYKAYNLSVGLSSLLFGIDWSVAFVMEGETTRLKSIRIVRDITGP